MKNRHGYLLTIQNDGTVKGTPDEASYSATAANAASTEKGNSNQNAILEFTPTDPPGAFRIRGIASNLYLSMDNKGRLYGESDRANGATVFAEHSQVRRKNTYLFLS